MKLLGLVFLLVAQSALVGTSEPSLAAGTNVLAATVVGASTQESMLPPQVQSPDNGGYKSSNNDGNREPREYSAWWALFVIALSGAFGGFVDGMRATRTYHVRFGSRSADWGSVADALVGMAASVAIFAFAESIFGGGQKLSDMVTAWFLIKIVAWGVLSGYAGTKLLDDLSSKAIRQMIGEETSKQVSRQISTDQGTQQIIQEAHQLRIQYLARVAAIGRETLDPDAEGLLQKAILKFRGVREKDRDNRDANNGLANSLADLGDYYKKLRSGDRSSKAAALFKEAIQIQDELIRQDPSFSKAYYNRACYKATAGETPSDKDQAVEDLKEAIKRDEQWRAYARTDSDLESLHEHPYWKEEIASKT